MRRKLYEGFMKSIINNNNIILMVILSAISTEGT